MFSRSMRNITGSGTLIFDVTSFAPTIGTGNPLTVDCGITIRTGLGGGQLGACTVLGTVSAQTAGKTLAISSLSYNGVTLIASGGGILSISTRATIPLQNVVDIISRINSTAVVSGSFSNGGTIDVSGAMVFDYAS